MRTSVHDLIAGISDWYLALREAVRAPTLVLCALATVLLVAHWCDRAVRARLDD